MQEKPCGCFLSLRLQVGVFTPGYFVYNHFVYFRNIGVHTKLFSLFFILDFPWEVTETINATTTLRMLCFCKLDAL